MKYICIFLLRVIGFILYNIGFILWEGKTVAWKDIQIGTNDEY